MEGSISDGTFQITGSLRPSWPDLDRGVLLRAGHVTTGRLDNRQNEAQQGTYLDLAAHANAGVRDLSESEVSA